MLKRIDRTLKAGELTAEGMEAIVEDTPKVSLYLGFDDTMEYL